MSEPQPATTSPSRHTSTPPHHQPPNDALSFLPQTIHFPHDGTWQRVEALTPFTKNLTEFPHPEGRIVFAVKQVPSTPDGDIEPDLPAEAILKVKVQLPFDAHGTPQEPVKRFSEATAMEVKALEMFADKDFPNAPHIINWMRKQQGDDGLLPQGFVHYVLMTRVPGRDLLRARFWQLPYSERERIQQEFRKALEAIHEMGIAPMDSGLRNIVWDSETGQCFHADDLGPRGSSIVDFESWLQWSLGADWGGARDYYHWGLGRSYSCVDVEDRAEGSRSGEVVSEGSVGGG